MQISLCPNAETFVNNLPSALHLLSRASRCSLQAEPPEICLTSDALHGIHLRNLSQSSFTYFRSSKILEALFLSCRVEGLSNFGQAPLEATADPRSVQELINIVYNFSSDLDIFPFQTSSFNQARYVAEAPVNNKDQWIYQAHLRTASPFSNWSYFSYLTFFKRSLLFETITYLSLEIRQQNHAFHKY